MKIEQKADRVHQAIQLGDDLRGFGWVERKAGEYHKTVPTLWTYDRRADTMLPERVRSFKITIGSLQVKVEVERADGTFVRIGGCYLRSGVRFAASGKGVKIGSITIYPAQHGRTEVTI